MPIIADLIDSVRLSQKRAIHFDLSIIKDILPYILRIINTDLYFAYIKGYIVPIKITSKEIRKLYLKADAGSAFLINYYHSELLTLLNTKLHDLSIDVLVIKHH